MNKKVQKLDKKYINPVLKPLLTMKLILMLICGIGLLTSTAEKSYSQNKKLSFSFQNVRLKSVLEHIEKNSEFSFMYESNNIELESLVDVTAKNETIEVILERLLENNLGYKIAGRHILLFSFETTDREEIGVLPQKEERPVSGVVTDEEGQLLPGVTVVVKGTTQGTVTDVNGTYALPDVPEDAVLVFSFIGMRT
ncbi:MAG TPA: carboxypeptidase-like regulatory domain-containing protein, partial [Mariniphaga sp.]|nr:carboxypeptidase-like regulatory domain-containing protein [Mariniphaga sp.]